VSVKDNQRQLLAEAVDALGNASPARVGVHEDQAESSHGRIVVRSIKTFQFKPSNPAFASVNCAVQIHRHAIEKRSGDVTDEDEIYVSSLPMRAMQPGEWLRTARGHWKVESLHHVKDRTLKEDRCTARGTSAVNMSTLRSLAVNLLQKAAKYAPRASDAFKADVQKAINIVIKKRLPI
jgi:predicted transposase YbfD/YdcC